MTVVCSFYLMFLHIWVLVKKKISLIPFATSRKHSGCLLLQFSKKACEDNKQVRGTSMLLARKSGSGSICKWLHCHGV